MHEKDRIKIIKAGFTLYRCSELELVVKRQSVAGQGWKIESRHKTKKAIEVERQRLLNNPKVIQSLRRDE